MSDLGQKGEPHYLALIGDIRKSRRAADRGSVQSRLEEALGHVNEHCREHLASDLIITLGDEFQGLSRRPEILNKLLAAFDRHLPGISIRYGVGWGTLDTELRPQAIGMDGPCFHAARTAIELGKQSDRWVTLGGFGQDTDNILNGMFALMGAVRAGWTSTQAQTVASMRHFATQKAVAEERGVAESTISKALSGALYGPLMAAECSVTTILANIVAKESDRPFTL